MSTLNVSNISDGTTTVGTSYVVNGSAKAWNSTNAAGTTINDSMNISSLTDVGIGAQDHNVSSSFANGYYTAVFSVAANYNQQWVDPTNTTYWRTNKYDGAAYQDTIIRTVAHGDLA